MDEMKAGKSRRYMILLQMLLPEVGEINVVKFGGANDVKKIHYPIKECSRAIS